MGFTEGPVITAAGDIVVASIDHGRLYAIRDGEVSVLAETRGGPNGAAEGADGRIFVAQNGGKWPATAAPDITGGVQVVTPDGSIDWLTRDPVSPNDLCFGPDGSLYVTDPTRRQSRDDGRIWRCNIETGEAELLVSLPWFPNGIGFGIEDDAIYVASTGDAKIIRFPLNRGRLGSPEVVIAMKNGHPDGFAFDLEGNVVIAALSLQHGQGEIQTWSIDGIHLDTFLPGPNSHYTNVAISPDRTLIVADSDGGAVLAVDGWPSSGLPLHPFR